MKRTQCLAVATALMGMLAFAGCDDGKSGGGNAVKRINGGGATFVAPIMLEWAAAFESAKGIKVDYQPKGSGNGIQQMTEKNIHFGCSDAPMKKAQLDKANETGGEVIHIPVIMGPVVPAYNVPGVTNTLVFSGQVLADIYLGKITKWNDEALKKLNPDAGLPDLTIAPVYRSEASGTTNIFTEYLSKASPEFKSKVGASTQPTWPKGVGTGERENAGVANRVKSSAGAIGYVELGFAKKGGIAYGAVVNRAGKPVLGSPESVTIAAANAMTVKQDTEPYSLHELTYSLTDAAGEGSYPISGISYAVVYRKQPAEMAKALKAFLSWVVADGQAMAPNMDYAALPADLVIKIKARLEQIELTP